MRKNKKRFSVLILLLLLAVVTVGYALLSSTLTINGTSQITNSSWDVHFENVSITDGSVTATEDPTIDTSTKLNISYEVSLPKPGDFYEFTVDVKNAGTVAAKLSALPTVSGVSDAQDVYTNYTFTHTDETPIVVGETLAPGASKNFTVRVEYDKNINASQLPTSLQNMTLTVGLSYEQA